MQADDEVAHVTGTVSAAEQPLISKVGKRACVYWDARYGLSDEPHEVGKQNFWIEADIGRVYVVSDHVMVEARAERGRQLLAVADADLLAVSVRLREMKTELRGKQGTSAARLQQERNRLARVATLLHATRAHARGRVHLGGSLAGQAEWIKENAVPAKEGPGAATATMALETWEVVIEEGQRVTIEGAWSKEAIAPELGSGAGYRSRITARALRGSAGEPLRITGVGAIAPERTAVIEKPKGPSKIGSISSGRQGRPTDKTGLYLAIAIVIIVLAAMATSMR